MNQELTSTMKALIAYVSNKNPNDIIYSDYLELSKNLKVTEPMIKDSKQIKEIPYE